MAGPPKRSSFFATVALLAIVGPPLAWRPTLIRGAAASVWVSHYAALDEMPRPRRAAARAIAARIDAAVFNLAPLPQASAAARLGLEIARRAREEEHDREAALLIYEGVRGACARVRGRPLGGAGFAVIEARALALESALRADTSK